METTCLGSVIWWPESAEAKLVNKVVILQLMLETFTLSAGMTMASLKTWQTSVSLSRDEWFQALRTNFCNSRFVKAVIFPIAPDDCGQTYFLWPLPQTSSSLPQDKTTSCSEAWLPGTSSWSGAPVGANPFWHLQDFGTGGSTMIQHSALWSWMIENTPCVVRTRGLWRYHNSRNVLQSQLAWCVLPSVWNHPSNTSRPLGCSGCSRNTLCKSKSSRQKLPFQPHASVVPQHLCGNLRRGVAAETSWLTQVVAFQGRWLCHSAGLWFCRGCTCMQVSIHLVYSAASIQLQGQRLPSNPNTPEADQLADLDVLPHQLEHFQAHLEHSQLQADLLEQLDHGPTKALPIFLDQRHKCAKDCCMPCILALSANAVFASFSQTHHRHRLLLASHCTVSDGEISSIHR